MSEDLLAALMAGAATAARERARVHHVEVERAAADWTPRGALFRERLLRPGVQVIAECKRRSPSRGVLREHYDPAAIARAYAAAGAAALSILTEPTFFDGSLEHLAAARAAVDIPLLRKDFISDVYQLVEARAAGADAILLIVAGLDDEQLLRLLRRAEAEGYAALVEVHSREELRRAIGAGATIVGVNSRNLKTLTVDLRLHEELVLGIPAGTTAVAESGLTSGADLRRLRETGYDAFLIGERFMAAADPGDALAVLLRDASATEARA
jgi:indole-3-glycerol phosphate synthase